MAIKQEKLVALEKEMEECGVFENDLVEKFILGAGPGGQKINKTHSTVYLKHIPTGIEVKCQKERSQVLNRYYARKELVEKIKTEILKVKTERRQEIEKIKRQKKRKSRKQKQKMIEDKKRKSEVKEGRKSPQE